ncbi:MAG: hypothetical protein U1E86_18915 [Burkholderiaceae bacterium]
MTATDSLTVLMCQRPRIATKRAALNTDGEVAFIPFNAGMYFKVISTSVVGIADLSEVLTFIEKEPTLLVIRGISKTSLGPDDEVRRLQLNFGTPEAGHHWVCIDIDHIAWPKKLRGKLDSKAVREYVVSLLPPEFHRATYHWQLSSRAGFGDDKTISIHLWFWFSRPVSDADLKRWADLVNDKAGYKLVDKALFNDVQPHYTAAPIFDAGVTNPFPVRSGLERKANDEVDLILPPAPQNRAIKHSSGTLSPAVGFDGYLARIGDHKGGDGFHNAILAATASYVAANGADGTNVEALYERVSAVVLAADRTAHDDAYVEHMASREHIMPMIEGAVEKFGEAGDARRKSKQVEGIEPYYKGETIPVGDAVGRMKEVIDFFFRRP